MVKMEETIRKNEEGRSIRHPSNYPGSDNPMENDEAMEEILRYAPKEYIKFVNGVLGIN